MLSLLLVFEYALFPKKNIFNYCKGQVTVADDEYCLKKNLMLITETISRRDSKHIVKNFFFFKTSLELHPLAIRWSESHSTEMVQNLPKLMQNLNR